MSALVEQRGRNSMGVPQTTEFRRKHSSRKQGGSMSAHSNMVTFAKDNKTFVFRTAGIMIHDGKVLLHRASSDDFWSLPGGRVELLERAETAIVREMQEELNVEVKVDRLVWLVEHFFETHKRAYHELSLFFLLQLPQTSPILQETCDFYGQEKHFGDTPLQLIFRWFPFYHLDMLTLYPTFLKKGLCALPSRTEHLAHIGNGTLTVT
jgi:ADP-ribose pyrophosphatase YjhB (NUDIX family)